MKFRYWVAFFVTLTSYTVQAQQDCEQAIRAGDHQLALPVCEQALIDHPEARLDLWLQLVEIHHVLGHRQKEYSYLQAISQHPKFNERTDVRYNWHRKQGQFHYFKGAYEQALKHLQAGFELAGQLGDPLLISKSHNDLGLVHGKLSHYTEALHHYQQSLQIKLSHGDAYQVGNTLNNIALVHVALEDHDQALNYYQQAMDQYLAYAQTEDFDERVLDRISHLYEDLTQAHSRKGQPEAAAGYVRQILATFESRRSPQAQARALANIGQMYLAADQFAVAAPFYLQAQALHQQYDLPHEARFYLDLARIKKHQQADQQAISLIITGISLAEQIQDHQTLSQLYELLSDLYRPEDLDKSLVYLKKYQQNRELFLQEKYDQQLSNVQHQIELQQIEHDLVNEQLISARQSVQLQQLTNATLWAVLVILLLAVTLMMYVFRKRKERAALMQSIKHHRQQLFMMQEEQEIKQHSQSADPAERKQQFKVMLVELMVDALACWEKNTGQDRIELAEQSRAWTVSVDNGTLRTRSLDKYLELEKMPANPRWRQVVKTCHFILSHESLDNKDRGELEHKLDQVLNLAKEMSLSAR
ncbi:tetratricopeptide repeat protein [Marinicella sediminis]|uniref:Tetratricopeptide repeat protein n=1 Tax=Marinicella sediminis TaxID=1792834 RepID=A0ABV7J5F0_9GAMM|nr:tetratricopeptide repeat protein [Marinicella sediminis]